MPDELDEWMAWAQKIAREIGEGSGGDPHNLRSRVRRAIEDLVGERDRLRRERDDLKAQLARERAQHRR